LASYIASELKTALGEATASITQLEVGVDECDGQWGVYRWSPK
jgi:6-pyruvoyltetrahydropterin/6-carboxytetrahydropterin synthase